MLATIPAQLLAPTLAVLAFAGLLQAIAGAWAVTRFLRQAAPGDVPGRAQPGPLPPVSILKPLHGDEPMLEAALASFCAEDYPAMQIVFGVQDPLDPAIAVVRRLQRRFPALAIDLVIDGTPHGVNRKVANLINMFPAARHDVIVIADSDVHVAPGYLKRVVAALQTPGTGLVTTVYSGLAAGGGLPSTLGATQISHVFLPGALMARALGRQDCLGATMALTRETLAAVGGLAALAHHIADDAVLGRLVAARGLAVRLAPTVPATTVTETAFGALFHHELRWGRTIRAVAPFGYAASLLQFPIVWAAAACLAAGAAPWSLALLAAAWAGRAACARAIDRSLGLPAVPAWLLPLRDVLSFAVVVFSYRRGQVRWRGQVLRVGRLRYGGRAYLPAAE